MSFIDFRTSMRVPLFVLPGEHFEDASRRQLADLAAAFFLPIALHEIASRYLYAPSIVTEYDAY